MKSSQKHGFVVEDLFKKEFDHYASHQGIAPPPIHTRYTAKFDVPAHRDPYGKGLPTSIKTALYSGPKTLVYLSDAVRIVGLGQVPQMRLLVALYKQDGQQKNFSEVREYIIEANEWKALMGDVPTEMIEDFHNDLKQPDHTKARMIAREWRKKLAEEYPSDMRWNAKVDTKNQRRLQCSVRLQDLERAITNKNRIRVFGKPFPPVKGEKKPAYLREKSRRLWGSGLCLPFRVDSPPRVRHSSKKTVNIPAASLPQPSRRMKKSMV
jgi:hypothetical protein